MPRVRLTKDHSEIRCLVEAIGNLTEAQANERKARDEYEGSSWGYFGQSYFEAIDRASEELTTRLNEYIDGRVSQRVAQLEEEVSALRRQVPDNR